MINNSPYKSRHQKETKSSNYNDLSPSDFNLSDKIVAERNNEVLRKIDVKEFIRLLKDKIENAEQSGYINDEQIDLRIEIDKLSGDKLI